MELNDVIIGYFRSEMDHIIKQAATATKTNPELWERSKAEAKAKMGGKHSARAMQLATQIYKKKGGGYSGAKPTAKNNSLKKWGKQKWQWSKEKKAMMNMNMSGMGMQQRSMNPMMSGIAPGMMPKMPGYAKGGIVKKDPKGKGKIIRVAEDGDEAIVPLTKKKRARKVAKMILRKTQ